MWAEEKSRSTAVYFQKINSPSSIYTLPGLTMTCFEKVNKNKIDICQQVPLCHVNIFQLKLKWAS